MGKWLYLIRSGQIGGNHVKILVSLIWNYYVSCPETMMFSRTFSDPNDPLEASAVAPHAAATTTGTGARRARTMSGRPVEFLWNLVENVFALSDGGFDAKI